MKRSKIYLITSAFLIATSLAMTSCSNKENTTSLNQLQNEDIKENESQSLEVEKEDNIQSTATDLEKEETKSTNNNSNENTSSKKESASKTEENLSKRIPYPTFNNINNKDKVNEVVLNYVKKLDSLYNSNGEATLNINYQIMFQNNKYISIYFSGDINSPTAAYPSKFRSTLNINIEKGSLMRLNEIANINEKFIDILNKAVESKFQSLGVQAPDNLKLENLNSLLQQTDSSSTSEAQSYFTSNEVVLILSVPHAIGDYIEINIPRSSIENYIN
ncbi:hypothetical protein [Clostridium mediterraneense]|uniref:hypothetical protein n=1 Tax=Clostridium mediterraneense TaxID=1805472 RepID=UPI00082C8E5A|nr:hypothetical protein [Clostridium mediterraneense]